MGNIIKLIISCLNVNFKKLIVWLQLYPKLIASDYITTGRPLGRTKAVHTCVTPQGAWSRGSDSTGPLSDLQYRQVRLDWWSTLRMRARHAPLPPTTADCHLDYFPACMPPRLTEYRWRCGSEMWDGISPMAASIAPIPAQFWPTVPGS